MYSPNPIFINSGNPKEIKVEIKNAFISTFHQYEDLFDSIEGPNILLNKLLLKIRIRNNKG